MNNINSEDFSYETFMNDLIEKFGGLLDKLNDKGGNE